MKGTGTWTIKAALDLLVPIPTMAAAVDSREMSALKDERVAAEQGCSAAQPPSSPATSSSSSTT